MNFNFVLELLVLCEKFIVKIRINFIKNAGLFVKEGYFLLKDPPAAQMLLL